MINELTQRMNEYRKRATQAEQENARLRDQLSRPKYAGLQKTVTEMLKLPIDAPLNEIARVLKYLRDNKDLYEEGRGARVITGKERQEIMETGVQTGKQIVMDRIVEFLKQQGRI